MALIFEKLLQIYVYWVRVWSHLSPGNLGLGPEVAIGHYMINKKDRASWWALLQR
jgi:hypothetical protein